MTTLRRILQLSAKEAATSGSNSTPRQSPNLSDNEEDSNDEEEEELEVIPPPSLKRVSSAASGASSGGGGPGRKKSRLVNSNNKTDEVEKKKVVNNSKATAGVDSQPIPIPPPRISFDVSNIVVITKYDEEEEEAQKKKRKAKAGDDDNSDDDDDDDDDNGDEEEQENGDEAAAANDTIEEEKATTKTASRNNKASSSKDQDRKLFPSLNIPPPPPILKREASNASLTTKSSVKSTTNAASTASNPITRASAVPLQRATSTGSQKPGKKSTMQNPPPSVLRKVEWVMCEMCKQWRKLPPSVLTSSLPEVWKCSMNTWDLSRATCFAPQEMDDEQLQAPIKPVRSASVVKLPDGINLYGGQFQTAPTSTRAKSYRDLIVNHYKFYRTWNNQMNLAADYRYSASPYYVPSGGVEQMVGESLFSKLMKKKE